MRERLNISPQLYARVTAVALAALALIVLTGAAVRLTGSGNATAAPCPRSTPTR